MECHEMAAVGRLYRGGQRVPHTGPYVAHDVAAHYPHDVRLILIAARQELAVAAGLPLVHHPCFHHAAPYTHHADVKTGARSLVDDEVKVVPVAVHPVTVGQAEVEPSGHRHLPVCVERRDGVNHLHLHHIESRPGAALQII